ncbi:MAG: intradiol ring-cleavage dioxygenase [Sphingobium sp.]
MRKDRDHGLARDLAELEGLAVGRRHMLGLMASAGSTAFLVGCGGSDSSSASTDVTISTGTSTATPTPTPTSSDSSSSGSSSSSSTCTVYADETNGPYPADGTNTSNGATSNVLVTSGIVRSDIRPSFISSSTVAGGVMVTFTITLVDANDSCSPLAGYAVYVWHCDADGDYSLYDLPGESYLRGVQVTDENGQCTFTTIFPGCYAGRYPHIHFETYSSLSNATSGRYAVLISQFAMPADACTTVYASSDYSGTSQRNFASTSIASDNVFGDNMTAQQSAMTVTMSGSVADGYTASATVGIAT